MKGHLDGAGPRIEPLMEFPKLSGEDLRHRLAGEQRILVLDVRELQEIAALPRKLPGAHHVPATELRARCGELRRDRLIVVYGSPAGPEPAQRAAEVLRQAGFRELAILEGGFQKWLAAGYPTEAMDPPSR